MKSSYALFSLDNAVPLTIRLIFLSFSSGYRFQLLSMIAYHFNIKVSKCCVTLNKKYRQYKCLNYLNCIIILIILINQNLIKVFIIVLILLYEASFISSLITKPKNSLCKRQIIE